MKTNSNVCRGYRFPGENISHSVWLYHRFSLSFRDVEDLLAKRGITVSHETSGYGAGSSGPSMHEDSSVDRGELHYLLRAVDQDGDVIDILVQRYRNARVAKRFFRKLLKGHAPCSLSRTRFS